MKTVSLSDLSIKELITLFFLFGITYIGIYYVGKKLVKPESEDKLVTQ